MTIHGPSFPSGLPARCLHRCHILDYRTKAEGQPKGAAEGTVALLCRPDVYLHVHKAASSGTKHGRPFCINLWLAGPGPKLRRQQCTWSIIRSDRLVLAWSGTLLVNVRSFVRPESGAAFWNDRGLLTLVTHHAVLRNT
jgi:hypothetical protein